MLAGPTSGFFFVCIFCRPRHRNCLRFMLGLINVSINKNKFCQEKSGMNQFWLWSLLHLLVPTTSGMLMVFRSSTLINFERFTSDNKDILQRNLWFPPPSVWESAFSQQNNPASLQSHTSVKHNKRWVWEEKLRRWPTAETNTNSEISPVTSIWRVTTGGASASTEEKHAA